MDREEGVRSLCAPRSPFLYFAKPYSRTPTNYCWCLLERAGPAGGRLWKERLTALLGAARAPPSGRMQPHWLGIYSYQRALGGVHATVSATTVSRTEPGLLLSRIPGSHSC